MSSRLFALGLALAATTIAFGQQGHWPLERRDRYGSAKAVLGPSAYGTPWISNLVAPGYALSHAPSLGLNGIGYFGGWNNRTLYKFNYRNGDILASFNSLEFVTSTPAIASEDTIYFHSEGGSGRLFRISTSTFDYDWASPQGNYYGGSPNIGNDGHIVQVRGNGTVEKRDSATGNLIWSYVIGSQNGGSGSNCAFTRNNRYVIAGGGNSVFAINYSDGALVWRKDLGSATGSPGVAPDGTVVIGTNGGLIAALNFADGSIKWSATTLAKQMYPPAFDGDFVYIGHDDARLYKYRISTGQRIWRFEASYSLMGGPVVGHDGRVYVHTMLGDAYCVSPAGAQIWKVFLGGQPRGPMTLGPDGTLYMCRNAVSFAPETCLLMVRQTKAKTAGKISFSRYVGALPTSLNVSLRLRGSTGTISSATATITPPRLFAAEFDMPFYESGNGARGMYSLSIKPLSYLRRTVDVDLRSGGQNGILFDLVIGDVVENNKVDQADVDAILAALSSVPGDANWNPRADVNGDLVVNTVDRNVVTANLGKVGDN